MARVKQTKRRSPYPNTPEPSSDSDEWFTNTNIPLVTPQHVRFTESQKGSLVKKCPRVFKQYLSPQTPTFPRLPQAAVVIDLTNEPARIPTNQVTIDLTEDEPIRLTYTNAVAIELSSDSEFDWSVNESVTTTEERSESSWSDAEYPKLLFDSDIEEYLTQ